MPRSWFSPVSPPPARAPRPLPDPPPHTPRCEPPSLSPRAAGGDLDAAQLRRHARAHFNVDVPRPFAVVRLECRALLDPSRYPVATMALQALGSVVVAVEALGQRVPGLFVDTTGWAFAYPLARLCGARVACYVHYPAVSAAMAERVASRRRAYNNPGWVASSAPATTLKGLYYAGMERWYRSSGRWADCTMANSTWTRGHVERLWGPGWGVDLVHPPVDAEELGLARRARDRGRAGGGDPTATVAVAQFRPEKGHATQLRAFAMALGRWDKLVMLTGEARALLEDTGSAANWGVRPGGLARMRGRPRPRLVLVGTCRGRADRELLARLRDSLAALGVSDAVTVLEGAPWGTVRDALASAAVGLHAMEEEHFGIGVVECMAAGCVAVAHASGGPLLDVVVPAHRPGGHSKPASGRASPALPGGARAGGGRGGGGAGEGEPGAGDEVGFLCREVDEYAEALMAAWTMSAGERAAMVRRAQARARRFAPGRFAAAWVEAIAGVAGGGKGACPVDAEPRWPRSEAGGVLGWAEDAWSESPGPSDDSEGEVAGFDSGGEDKGR